jgi:hypothetical protein
VCYRLIDPGSEWRLHRHWYDANAMGDLLGEDFALAESHKLYRCLDKLVVHKEALFSYLQTRWHELFNARFDVLLYDLTSTYFEYKMPVVSVLARATTPGARAKRTRHAPTTTEETLETFT